MCEPKTQKSDVGFSAVIEKGGAYGPFSTDVTVVFNKVITNVGDAYNSSTGIVSAPAAGLYHFTFFYHAGGEHKSALQLFKNGVRVVMSSDHATSSDGADNGGNATVLQLQEGDQVFVRLPANCHIWAAEDMCSFSGFLI